MGKHWKFWAGFVSLGIGIAGLISTANSGDSTYLIGGLWWFMLSGAFWLDCRNLAQKEGCEKNVE